MEGTPNNTGTSSRIPRLLVAIASYGSAQDKYLHRLIEEYRSMSFDTHVVVISNVDKPLPNGVELSVGLPTRNPWSLPFAHKKILADRADDYDLFIYSEDDTLITQKNIETFLTVCETLPETDIPGFLRYENGPKGLRHYINLHGHYHWDPASAYRSGPYTFAFLTNEHSACYLLTAKQLRSAIDSGRYLVAPYQGRYDMLCTAATDPYTVCGFRKVICISHLEHFLVHHLPDKYTNTECNAADQRFDKQVRALIGSVDSRTKPVTLLDTETKLRSGRYRKAYDEPAREEVFDLLPASVHTLLSVGSGWGTAERSLEQRGLQVTALPLDSIVGACLEDDGVEIVCGDFETARRKLDGRTFDCLFLSNIVHLVSQPVELLRSYGELVAPGAWMLLVSPNIANLKNSLLRFARKQEYRDLVSHEKTGVQYVSKRAMTRWLDEAGFRLESIKWGISPKYKRLVRLSRELLDPMFASEMIVLARKSG